MGAKQVALTEKKRIPEPFNSPKSKSTCKECGTIFSQVWNDEVGKYSEFKQCPACRAMTSGKTSKKQINLDYEPHRYQRLVHNSKARFKVISAGARGGKDYCCVVDFFVYLMRCANEERPPTLIPRVMGWIIAPTDMVARQNWRDLKRVIPKELIADESRSTGQMNLINGVLIELHSAYDPESLVAVGLDAVLITEAARVKDLETVWDNLEMRLNSPFKGVGGNGGMALINSSPLGRNHFYKMFRFGQKNSSSYDPDWESFHWTTWDNPYMAVKGDKMMSNGRTYKENLRRRMSENRYRQDILAEFIAEKGHIFSDIRECLEKLPEFSSELAKRAYIEEWRAPKPYKSYWIGYDPAEGSSDGDDPIIWIVEEDTGKLMRAVNFQGAGFNLQFDRIAYYSALYNYAPVIFGKTGHTTVEEALQERGLTVIPKNEQGYNKQNLVENLVIVVQNRKLIILDDGTDETEYLLLEFEDYIKDGQTYHNATSKGHDDHVSAAYFAFADKSSERTLPPFDGLLMGV